MDRWFPSPEQIPRSEFAGSKGCLLFLPPPERPDPLPAATKTLCCAKSGGASRRPSWQRGSPISLVLSLLDTVAKYKSCSCLLPRSSRLHFVGSRERESPRKLKAFQGLLLVTGCFAHCFVSEPAAGHSRLLLWEPSPKGPGVLLSPPAVGGSLLCVLPSLNLRVCPCLPARFPSRFPGPRGP